MIGAPHGPTSLSPTLRAAKQVAFLRKAWSQARCALLGLQEPQVEEPFLLPGVGTLGFLHGLNVLIPVMPFETAWASNLSR